MAKQPNERGERILKYWYQHVRRIIIGVAGGSLVVLGLVLFVLPGPFWLLIPLGVALLGTQFPWAKRLMRRSKAWLLAKLPASEVGRINWLFAKVARLVRRIAKWLRQYLIKPLTPPRKRV